MKCCELDFPSILAAWKHRWKGIVVSVVCFAVVGALCGGLYAQRGAAAAQGSAQPLETLETAPDLSVEDAYSLFQNDLERTYQNVNSYYTALAGSEFLTDEEQKAISDAQEELNSLYEEQIAPAREQMDRYGAIYVPAAFLSEQTASYEAQLAQVELNLISAKEAAETIRQMGAPALGTDSISNTYASLLSQAANYGSLLQSKTRIQFYLERLTTQQEEILDECQELLALQEEIAASLNEQIIALNTMADQHAAANHLSFLVSYDNEHVATVTLIHTHGTATAQDNFLLVFLFCTLTGLCVGLYFTVCLECGTWSLPWSKKKGRA